MNGITVTEDEFLLLSLTKACRIRNDKIRTRLPIQKGMLCLILKETRNYFLNIGQPYLAILYQTIFCSCYYGLLCSSEVCGAHPVLAWDVHIATNKKKFLFVLRTSKTHGLGSAPQIVKFTAVKKSLPKIIAKNKLDRNSTKFCPYKLLTDYAHIRGSYKRDYDPFFMFTDGCPIQPSQLSACLKKITKMCRLDQSLYSMHSLRLGQTCDLYQMGLSVKTIKKLGRWRSNVVFRYLKT